MSRIFAAVSVSTILLVTTAAVGSAITETETEHELFDDVVGIVTTGLDLTTLVPFVLFAALLLAAVGVMARL